MIDNLSQLQQMPLLFCINLSNGCLHLLQGGLYTVAQKAEPLPNYPKKDRIKSYLSLRIRLDFHIKHYHISINIKYSMCELVCDLNN